jgi:pyridoxine 4-dehydrogenase
LEWVRHLSQKDGNPEIIPIPGATTVDRIQENVKDYPLDGEESAAIASILKGFEVSGARYGGPQAALVEG